MLISLNVKNFAIIDNMQIEFQDGMTCLTGETGAGKSLIIDAIGLLFGKRASTDLIRFNETKATIEGVFTKLKPEMTEIIELNPDDDVLIIKREIYANGKSLCKVNNQTVTLNQLNDLAALIGDIHTQYDTQGLFNPKNYLKFIDNSEVLGLIPSYQENLKKYREFQNDYQKLLKRSIDDSQRLEFLKYQIKELEQAQLSLEEEGQLQQQANYLSNFEQISTNINDVKEIFSEQQLLDHLYEALSLLKKVSQFDERYDIIQKKMEEIYYNLSDQIGEINKLSKSLDFDPAELDRINERLGLYSELKRKYKKNLTDLLLFQKQISEEINLIENFDDLLLEAKTKMDEAYQETLKQANIISVLRQGLAKTLVAQIITNLNDLQLRNTSFEIIFSNPKTLVFNQDGIDNVDFLVSFNPGEPLKPLSKVASGGELSRFMLALKTIVCDKLALQTIIFDEIDHGVSGAIAFSIANKIKTIAKNAQVLCVTHLPQVAAIADQHLHITKHLEDGRTLTKISQLDNEDRTLEIAKMISNGIATTASLNLAKELLCSHQIKNGSR
ncbi:MAG TPA: DNA repair protein RecN [Bacilli bacterium]|nr:MAG: DNA repair protein RecN [Tenericutes bacterium ADurb.BinA124]HNZ50575.1 DNA repair protein RecN [Bacilli bacterium]HPX84556.1 DNA repair protein RecN [Bacilli bacterium]